MGLWGSVSEVEQVLQKQNKSHHSSERERKNLKPHDLNTRGVWVSVVIYSGSACVLKGEEWMRTNKPDGSEIWLIGLNVTSHENIAQDCFHMNSIQNSFFCFIHNSICRLFNALSIATLRERFFKNMLRRIMGITWKKEEKPLGVPAQILHIITVCERKRGMWALFISPRFGMQWRDQEWCGADLYLDQRLNCSHLFYSWKCFRNTNLRWNKIRDCSLDSQSHNFNYAHVGKAILTFSLWFVLPTELILEQ